ncbi:MAG: alpha-1,4-glucan--maltose-1-phosphate maltosyltransferase [Acidobacteria bacterium]|nr:alpha-1,4-glucan--maltose-1-phosphate maltosyltransferase [Acidobacteriota bacterium]
MKTIAGDKALGSARRRAKRPSSTPAPPPRVTIEGVAPEIDGGRFDVKRTVGEDVIVEADIFADGHERLAAVLRSRYVGASDDDGQAEPWCEIFMDELGNDRWRARFRVDRLGRYEYSIQAWVDRFASWRDFLSKKIHAGADVELELADGAALLRETATRMTRESGTADAVADATPVGEWLCERAAALTRAGNQSARSAVALDPRLAIVMRRHDDRPASVHYATTLRVTVDRDRARFGSWYEMFPRSAGPDPSRSATFDEAAGRLPDIASMGFDVVYLPPVHPIGRTFRKGPNNALEAAPGDPGSPWAIGSDEGGHTSIEPGLGTLEDFDRFVDAARRVGLEVALDLAFHASPDHPYVREHPEWFKHRVDGGIQYAENPPKKYQDIYPFDFLCQDWQALWEELETIVLFWIAHGVKIFRVDNPHTKPLRFWEWLIAEVRKQHPDVVFLSEAFTRPKVMKYLAKLGFSQSYTYFTWRNTKAELTEHFTELTATEMREYFRPNLFANTPDILHAYLRQGGRAAFQVRLILAGTLGASYGIYSGFELCENRARAGTEEYLDSEKYQYRAWDWNRPGRITELVARLNGIRRANRALQSDRSLCFHDTDNVQILAYSKVTEDRENVILTVVNLDPVNMQHGWLRVPISDWAIAADAPYEMEDLLDDAAYTWRGERNYVRLEPGARPAHILRLKGPAEAGHHVGIAAREVRLKPDTTTTTKGSHDEKRSTWCPASAGLVR